MCAGTGCAFSHSEVCVCVCDVICYALSQREVSECVGARAGICFALSHTKLCVSVCMCV